MGAGNSGGNPTRLISCHWIVHYLHLFAVTFAGSDQNRKNEKSLQQDQHFGYAIKEYQVSETSKASKARRFSYCKT